MVASVYLNFGDWLGISSLVTAVAGLTVAFVQLHRVQSVANAAAETSQRNEKQIAGSMALARAPDLEPVELALRAASESDQRESAKDAVREWRRAAAEYQALLTAAAVSDAELDRQLAISLGLVDRALTDLADPSIEAEAACRYILRHIGDACMHSRRVAAGMMLHTTL